MADPTELFVKQLEALRASYTESRKRSRHDDLSDQGRDVVHALITAGRAAVARISGPNSIYSRQIDEVLATKSYPGDHALKILGVASALEADVKAGYVKSALELAHADLFADFLEMSEHLLSAGYKDAAAVIAGSTLEAHLRQLAEREGVPTTRATPDGPKPVKAEQLNQDLAAKTAYSKLDQKSVTAWLDLRNHAAHGHYDKYSADQVGLLIAGVRDFVRRLPA